MIKNVVIVNAGHDKNGDDIDEVFLSQIATQGNEQSQGVKSRFGHPGMCDDALGSYVGRYKNFQLIGGSVVADLHLDPVSAKSPKGNLFDYIVSMAETNNDMFGNSIVFRDDEPEVKTVEEDGVKVDKEFIRLKTFIASDLVDSPAATNSLFKSSTDFAAKATEFLNENPEMFQVIDDNPEVISEFISKYKTFKSMSKSKLSARIKNTLGSIAKIISGEEEKAIDQTTGDGTILHISDDDGDGVANVGDTVTVEGKDNPDGMYPMPDGSIINVMNGKIESITPKTAQEPPAPAEEVKSVEELTAEVARLSAEVKENGDKVTELESLLAEQEADMKAFEEQVVSLKGQVKSTFKPEGRTNDFKRTEPGEKSKIELAKEREAEYEEKRKAKAFKK